ncbi:hypothetical protein Plec18167_005201 [Paecilomyces lecythidis]|uniref:RING-type domain-containing protein n=1 Tax=Paecilomyces lecythidis TaxID=3004212 RepID=A0ABR3XM29_9EURO
MVLSLPVPSFSKSVSSPLRSRDTNALPAQRANPSTPAAKNAIKSTTPVTASTSSSSTLSEALRNNPFGTTPRSRALEVLSREADERREQEELNHALVTLTQLFPDVKIEVFRELLIRFDGQSRLQVVVEQLLRHKNEWVRGRWNVPDGNGSKEGDNAADGNAARADNDDDLVPVDERFRSEEYKAAVKTTLSKEFSGLSRSTIDAVLAETNFSYIRARPILRDLSRRTWRATFGNIFPFKRKKDKDDHPHLQWHRAADGELVPRLKETGNGELDRELHDMLLAPMLSQRRVEQEQRDLELAEELNENEAKAVNALYECECCLSDVTFEQISACSQSSHIICYGCIQRTTHEALFGQGWGRSIDPEKSTLRCLAPVAQGTCEGTLHPEIVKRAILSDKAGTEIYRKFEDRLASEALLKSQLKLVRCPFCSYAEVDPVYHPPSDGFNWRFRRGNLISTILMTMFLLDLIPLFIIPLIILLLLNPRAVVAILTASLQNLCLKIRSQRFICANPACRRASCITCQKAWRDPHVCHEPLLLSLRNTVEAARTAAIKRTCPRCGLSFVKSSGCNKLTCICGYSMCYLCRKALGPPLKNNGRRLRPRQNQENEPFFAQDDIENNDDYADPEEAQGYKHFCEHFRINPGSRCTECNKCDLYLAEDEEAVARRAGEKAEREWRIRQGMVGVTLTAPAASRRDDQARNLGAAWPWDMQLNSGKRWRYWAEDVWREGRWKSEGQAFIDWIVEKVVVVEGV